MTGALRRVQRTHDDRLHHALRFDGIGQLLQRLGPHVDARLILAALEQVHRQSLQLVVGVQLRDDFGLVVGARADRAARPVRVRGFVVSSPWLPFCDVAKWRVRTGEGPGIPARECDSSGLRAAQH